MGPGPGKPSSANQEPPGLAGHAGASRPRPVLKKVASLLALALAAGGLPGEDTIAEGSWPVQYVANDPRSARQLDLRYLNEQYAGEHGYISLDKHGDFRRGDGAPIRFWGVIANAKSFSPEQWSEQAGWLARMGVNMVRHQISLASTAALSEITDVNEAEIDQTWREVAAMRKQGIYTALIDASVLSEYGHVDMRRWGVDGYADNYAEHPGADKPWCVLFFNQRLRDGYKARLRSLYLRPNPYTGIPLAQDPAVLWSQIQTEDSLLFYTVNGLRKPQAQELSRQYAAWLGKKYGTLGSARAAWNNEMVTAGQLLPDDADHGQIGLYNIWEETRQAVIKRGMPSVGKSRRLADQVEFLAWAMHAFNADMTRFLHRDLGCKSLILADNWRPADAVTMQDAERWSDLPGDIMAENHFFTGMHQGAASGWRVTIGDRIHSLSALKLGELEDYPPYVMKKVDGRAGFITSTAWVPPNRYQSEGPLLCAAYGLLDGMNGFCWEGFGSQPEMDTAITLSINPQTTWLLTWNLARPPQVTAFPAAALLFRNGYLRRGATAVHEHRPLADLWSCKPAAIADHGAPAATAHDASAIDPLAFLVGPVAVAYGAAKAKVEVLPDLTSCIDRPHQHVRSDTGELQLDYGKGVCRIAAPKAQGVLGFLAGEGVIDLGDVAIASEDAYASILIVPLDDAPIATSTKLLIQSCTTAHPTGWTTKPCNLDQTGGKASLPAEEVTSLGGPPWRVADNRSTITIRNPHLRMAVSIDAEGYASGSVPCTVDSSALTLHMPPETFYVLVTGSP
jgi:hypothetical protein